MMKHMLVSIVILFTFQVPAKFNLQQFLQSAKIAGVSLFKEKNEDSADGHISLSGKTLKVTLYGTSTPTKEQLAFIVETSTAPIVEPPTLEERIKALEAQVEVLKNP